MARGRRVALDFAEAGAAIVAESGWAALTPPALAEHMGVHTTAVYRHFPSWNDLLVAVFDLSLGQLTEAAQTAEAAEASPREQISTFMRTVRAAMNADPYLVDCVYAILRSEGTSPMPNFDAASARLAALLLEMGVPVTELPAVYQALESIAIGTSIADFTGHPLHLVNRRRRRRMSGIPAFEEFSRNDETTMAVSEAAFELSMRLLLDECERLGREQS